MAHPQWLLLLEYLYSINCYHLPLPLPPPLLPPTATTIITATTYHHAYDYHCYHLPLLPPRGGGHFYHPKKKSFEMTRPRLSLLT